MSNRIPQRLSTLSGRQYIAGEWVVGTGPRHDIIDPATEQVIAQYADASPDEIERAVAAANQAQCEWWSTSALDRATLLHDVAARMLDLAPETGHFLTIEMGKPYREANWEGGASASAFRYYAELARNDQGRVTGPAIAGQLQMVVKEPLGTVVSIVPFNFPMLLAGWQAAAALAAGNAVIIKPSELTSMTLLAWMSAFEGLPAGLVQVLTGGAEVGAALVAHQHTQAVAFTLQTCIDRGIGQRRLHCHALG